jgi:hypothetical protein
LALHKPFRVVGRAFIQLALLLGSLSWSTAAAKKAATFTTESCWKETQQLGLIHSSSLTSRPKSAALLRDRVQLCVGEMKLGLCLLSLKRASAHQLHLGVAQTNCQPCNQFSISDCSPSLVPSIRYDARTHLAGPCGMQALLTANDPLCLDDRSGIFYLFITNLFTRHFS